MRILIHGVREHAQALFPNDELCYEDTPSGEYDAIFLSQTLQGYRGTRVPEVLDAYIGFLKPGGQLIVTVPDLEWACREMIKPGGSETLAYAFIYGDQALPHRSGFTMVALRMLLERAGLFVSMANTQPYRFRVFGEEVTGFLNIIMGLKELASEAAEAIE